MECGTSRWFARTAALCACSAVLIAACERGGDDKSDIRTTRVDVIRSTPDERTSPMRPRGRNEPASAMRPGDSSSSGTAVADTPLSPTVSGVVTIKGAGAAANAGIAVLNTDWDISGASPTEIRNLIAVTTASKQGKYRVPINADMTNYLQVVHPAGATMMVYVHHSRMYSGRSIIQNIEMEPAASVRGRVVDTNDQPIANASIRIMPPARSGSSYADTAETTSSADGTFVSNAVPIGDLVLAAVAENYAVTTQSVTTPADNVIVRLKTGGAVVEGAVYHALTNAGVAGSSVSLVLSDGILMGWPVVPRHSTLTDDLGSFRFAGLAAGGYRITAQKENLRLLPSTNRNAYALWLSDGETTSGVSLTIYPGHTVAGVVRDKATSEPLSGVKIFTPARKGNEKAVLTDADGHYSLPAVFSEGTSAYLQAEKSGYTLPRGRESYRVANITVKLPTENFDVAHDFDMVRTVPVSGFIRLENGDPVSGATASIYESSHSQGATNTLSDAKGYYELQADPYTKLRVKVETRTYPLTFSDAVDLDDRPTSVDVTLKPGATVIGRVVDEADAPVSDSTVKANTRLEMSPYISYQTCGETESGSDGSFTLSNLPSQMEVSFIASHSTLADSDSVPLSFQPAELRTDLKLILERPHFIAGKVTDSTSRPLEKIQVSAYPQRGGGRTVSPTAQTDKDGRYRLDKLKDTAYNVYAHGTAGGGSAQLSGVKADRDDADLVIAVIGKGVLIGKVVDASTKQPIKDFDVVAVNYQAGMKTEKDPSEPGKFTLSGLQERYGVQLTISAPGYQPTRTEYLSFQTGQTKLEKTFEMGAGGTITGRVIDRATKSPIPDVRVLWKGAGDQWNISNQAPVETKLTDSEGRFRFESAPAGTNHLQFKPDKPLVEVTRTIGVKHGETADLGDVLMGGGATLRVTVLRSPGDQPVENVQVRASNNRTGGTIKSGVTDKSGKVEFSAVSPGDYSISLPAYKTQKSITLADGDSKDEILRIGGSVFKATVLRNGSPVAGANVQLSSGPGGGSYYSQTDSDGLTEIKDIAAGTWTAQATQWTDSMNYMSTREKIEIPDGQTVEKTFVLTLSLLRGKVVDREGKPVAKARVKADKKSGADETYKSMTATGGDDGSWKMQMGGNGTFEVTAVAKGYGPSKPVEAVVAVNGESDEVVCTLTDQAEGGKLSSVTYRITDGKPLKEAWVKLKRADGSTLEHAGERGDDGVMTIEGIPAGMYDVEISGWGYSVANHPQVQVKVGETVRFEDVLYDCGSFDWTITDKDGNPMKDISVRFAADDAASIEPVREGKTGENGVYSARGILPGNYTAVASPSGKSPLSVQVTIEGHVGARQTSRVE